MYMSILLYKSFKAIAVYVLLGWTQTEIGDVFGLTHQAVSNSAKNVEADIIGTPEEYRKGLTFRMQSAGASSLLKSG